MSEIVLSGCKTKYKNHLINYMWLLCCYKHNRKKKILLFISPGDVTDDHTGLSGVQVQNPLTIDPSGVQYQFRANTGQGEIYTILLECSCIIQFITKVD